MVKNNVSEIKLIEQKEDIETYEANMKIKFKKIRKKNENDFYYYKSLLLNHSRIYDIMEENNNIYIYYDSTENLDEILNISGHKEVVIEGHCEPINKNEIQELFKKEDAMCKILSKKLVNGKIENINGTGFFVELDLKDIPFKKCLITNNHVLNENDIKINKEIKFEYQKINKTIKITDKRKTYTNKNLDYTCIEIFDNDEINEFFRIDPDIVEYPVEVYKDKDIFILQYPKGKDLSFSEGKILGFRDDTIIHNCSTYKGSSGSPIILRYSDNSIIGLHFGSDKGGTTNLSTNFVFILNDIKKYKKNNNEENINLKNSEIINKEKDIDKKRENTNSFEELKRNDEYRNDKGEDYKYNKKKETKEFYDIKITKDIIPYSYLNEYKDIGFDLSLLKLNKLYVNLIYFDLHLNKGEQYKYFSNFQLDVVGGFYAMDNLDILKEYLKAVEEKNIPYIVLSTGCSGKDVIPICKKYSFIKEVIIFCGNYEYNKYYTEEYPGYVNKVLTSISSVYDYIDSFCPEKYKKETEKYIKFNHFIFSPEDIEMSKQLQLFPLITASVYDKCLFLIHRAYAYFFGDINDKNDKPKFNSSNYNKIEKFMNNSELITEKDKTTILKKKKKIKDDNCFVESSIREYTGESCFCYILNKNMREAGKGLISLVYYMGPLLYGLNKYVKENPKIFSFKENLTLYRNIQLSKLDFYSYQINLNHIICFTSLTSTTTQPIRPIILAKNVNLPFDSNLIKVQMIIEYKHQPGNISPGIIVRNNKGKDNSYISSNPYEEEVILFPFTFLKIIKITKLKETYEMNLEIINRQSYIEYTLKDNVDKRILFSKME